MFGLAGDELEAAVQVFHVRSGKVVGASALFVDKAEDLSPAELMERILVDVYADAAVRAFRARCWSRPCRPTSTRSPST